MQQGHQTNKEEEGERFSLFFFFLGGRERRKKSTNALVGNRGKTRSTLCDGETTLLTDGDGEDVGVRLRSRHDGLTEEGKGGKLDARR